MNKTLVCILGLALVTPVYAATSTQNVPLDSIGGKPQGMNPAAMQDMMMQRFKQSDVDHNGALSRDEAQNMPMLAQHFDELDTNHDGQVSLQEVQAAFMQRMQQQSASVTKN
ncbi:EF-hand domain-containing protein [Sulfuriferula nivalis]|uniref:EF-hand domain-containing protein n=1 Tax=Sulfuriferula nivalis TaxID=2675298 RepID=A0A809RGU5_9PROT|nr:EF-hand domain-containing protein [Sulfuriferula nivalis]BBP00084.1 hypothetical protein SFSGTM_07920 [Sulfuriferula nivalis]